MKLAMFDTKSYDIPGFTKYANLNNIEIKFFDVKLSIDTVSLARGFDGVIVFVNDDINKNVINALYSYGIGLILLRCAGFNNVDVKEAFMKLHVLRVPSYSPESVAEHAMALLLTSIRRIHKAYIRTRDFNFSLEGLVGFDLYGKTVGVVGTGKIGKAFINIAKGFGMKIIAYDKFEDPNLDVEYKNLDDLFKEADVISLHCPLTDETTHMINKDSISLMKKGVVIINTSRGGLVDSLDLLNAIKERRVGAACLDVYEEEGNIFYHDYSNHIVDDDILRGLISMPNVIVTSHQGFLTEEALNNIADITIKNAIEYKDKKNFTNEVCYKCDRIEECRKIKNNKCF